jgi:hypothetical protein
VKAKVRAITGQTTNQPLAVVLHRLNWVLRGWANYCVPRGRARSVREEVRLVA